MVSQIHSDLQRNISIHWTYERRTVVFVDKKTGYLVKAEDFLRNFIPSQPPAEAGVEY